MSNEEFITKMVILSNTYECQRFEENRKATLEIIADLTKQFKEHAINAYKMETAINSTNPILSKEQREKILINGCDAAKPSKWVNDEIGHSSIGGKEYLKLWNNANIWKTTPKSYCGTVSDLKFTDEWRLPKFQVETPESLPKSEKKNIKEVSLLDDVKPKLIMSGRRMGYTTRQIDEAIQTIFAGDIFYAIDHYHNGANNKCNMNLYYKALKRIANEHEWLIKEKILIMEKSSGTHCFPTIQIDQKKLNTFQQKNNEQI